MKALKSLPYFSEMRPENAIKGIKAAAVRMSRMVIARVIVSK
jgi:hypothetical protein